MSCSCDPLVRIEVPHPPWDCRWDMSDWDRDWDPDCECGFNHISPACPPHRHLAGAAPIPYLLTEYDVSA